MFTFVLAFAMNELLAHSVGGQFEAIRRVVDLGLLIHVGVFVEDVLDWLVHSVNIILDEVRQLRKRSRLFSDRSQAKNGSEL